MLSFKDFYHILTESEGDKTDIHELITAMLLVKRSDGVLEKFSKSGRYTLDELKEGLTEVKENGSVDDIIGIKPADKAMLAKPVNEVQLKDFAKAVSAANAIKEHVGKVDKVFVTGKTWPSEVEKFKLVKHGMADYNSSDIVIKSGKLYYGISLKKKDFGSADPTLLNKSLRNLLSDVHSEEANALIDSLDKAQNATFTKILSDSDTQQEIMDIVNDPASGYSPELIEAIKDGLNHVSDGVTWKQLLGTNKKSLFYKKASDKEGSIKSPVKNKIRAIINDKLKKSNEFFKSIVKAFDQEHIALQLSDALIELFLKCGLKELKGVNFEFALCTGIAKVTKKFAEIHDAEYETVDTVVEALAALGDERPRIEVKDKALFLDDADRTTAGISATLYIGDTPVIDVIIRYKGQYGAYPNILGTLTPEFKNMIKNVHLG